MKPFLFIQNVSHEGPGLIAESLNKRNIPFECVDLYSGDSLPDSPDAYSAVVPLGGPMNVDEDDKYSFLREEKRFLRQCIDQNIVILGVCLGSQLLARVFEAEVRPNPVKEIGWMHVELTREGEISPLFKGLPSPLPVFQWHGDTFDIPANAVHLARSGACVNQAFSVNDRFFGLQFHLEVGCSDVAEWARQYLPSMRGLDAEQAKRLIESPEPDKASEVAAFSDRLIDNVLKIVQA